MLVSSPQILRTPRTHAQNAIILPHEFSLRHYQRELFMAVVPEAFKETAVSIGVKRAVLVWHRRAGKDKCSINLLVMLSQQRVGNYLYMAPEITQARKIIWNGIDKEGFRFIDHIPKSLIAKKTDADMFVTLTNGSTIQLGGADAYDRNMGTNPLGIVFSEYSLMHPIAWNYYRPILAENDGVAIFIYTPRGNNHGKTLYDIAKKHHDEGDPRWYCSLLSAEDTTRQDGTPVISAEIIQAEIDEGMPSEIVEQEFYCSFTAGVMGAYYADQMRVAEREGRIGMWPHDPNYPVITAWDLGLRDNTSIWFAQNIQGQCRLIDHESAPGVTLQAWAKLVREKPYLYMEHIAPPDIKNRDMMTGNPRVDQMMDLGIDFTVLNNYALEDGIAATRALLPRCTFNQESCEEGIDALVSYQKVYDERLRAYRNQPLHDWASHSADAMRYLALGWQDATVTLQPGYRKPRVNRAIGGTRRLRRTIGT